MTGYIVEYVDRGGDHIREATPFATIDEAFARTREIIVSGRARLGSVIWRPAPDEENQTDVILRHGKPKAGR